MENRMTEVDRLREAAQAVSDKARVVVDHRRPTKPRWVVEDAEFSALRAALEAAPVADPGRDASPERDDGYVRADVEART